MIERVEIRVCLALSFSIVYKTVISPPTRLSLAPRDSILQATAIENLNNQKEAHRLDETTVLVYTMDLSTGRIWCLCGPETSSQQILQTAASHHNPYISKPHIERLKMMMLLRNRGSLCVFSFSNIILLDFEWKLSELASCTISRWQEIATEKRPSGFWSWVSDSREVRGWREEVTALSL